MDPLDVEPLESGIDPAMYADLPPYWQDAITAEAVELELAESHADELRDYWIARAAEEEL